MSSNTTRPSEEQRIVVEATGPGEWIVGAPPGGRSLHIYRIAPGDWLVSEVGRGNEGRGADIAQALAVLSPGESAPDWWSSVAGLLDVER